VHFITTPNFVVIRLPEIHEELQHLLRKAEDDIRALPKPPSSDPFGEVLHLIGNFTRDLSRHLEGTTEKDGLLQTIRPAQLRFQQAIRSTAPEFRPYERKFAKSRTFTPPDFLAEQEIETEGPLSNNNSVIYIDEVFRQAQMYAKLSLRLDRCPDQMCLKGRVRENCQTTIRLLYSKHIYQRSWPNG
jgi:hypothetical protein